MAQANLVWVIKRALLIMDRNSGEATYKKGLDKYKSLTQFAKIWEQQVNKVKSSNPSVEVHALDEIIGNWDNLYKFGFLVHPVGRRATGELMHEYSKEKMEILLEAVGDVHKYAKSVGIDAFKRLPVYHSNSRRSRG